MSLLFPGQQKQTEKLFDELMEKHYSDIYKYILVKLYNNEQDAKDCTQNVFLTLYNNMSKIKDFGHILTWLYKTSNNFIARQIKIYARQKEEQIYLEDCNEIEIEKFAKYEDDYHSIFDNIIDVEKNTKRIIEQLTESELSLWYLYFQENRHIADICSILDISKTTATTRIYRLRVKIRRIIEELLAKYDDLSHIK